MPWLRTKFGERAFSHAGPAAWNALLEDIRANHDRAVFRKQLKTHFFTLAFNVRWLPDFRLLLYRVGDCVMHLCPICNRRTINVLDDDDDDDETKNYETISKTSFLGSQPKWT